MGHSRRRSVQTPGLGALGAEEGGSLGDSWGDVGGTGRFGPL